MSEPNPTDAGYDEAVRRIPNRWQGSVPEYGRNVRIDRTRPCPTLDALDRDSSNANVR